mmetsp:Transcript_115797/g.210629  ORF Transcript_115797/g.210629 Transcript_115797/m.210629 type:complete len:214 (+) Transcript_115797:2957-3598(+)
MVHLAETTAQHNRLHPLEPFPSFWHAMPKRPRPATDQRLAKLVAVVAGPVGGVHEDLQWLGHVSWIGKLFRLPGQLVAWNVKVSHRVTSNASKNKRTLTSALTISKSATSTGLSTCKWSNATRKVVRLNRARDVKVALCLAERARLRDICHPWLWEERGVLEAPQCAGVVFETDRAVGRAHLERSFDQLEERLRHLFIINHHLATKKPMPTVL